ncbi:hypothetical protein WA171_004350 [Blastocystis sp. BT1]
MPGEQNEEASPTLDPKPVVDDSTSLEELSRPYAHLQKKEMKAPVGSSTGTGELEESIESMPSSESLLYETRSKLLVISSDRVSLLDFTPIAFSTASSTTSLPSVESLNLNQKIPLAADISASILTSSNNQAISIKDMEESPELMVVMTRIEAGLLSSCKRISMILQEAIRQREEATLSNEVDIRNFNNSMAMSELKECEENEKRELEGLEDWYECQVTAVENSFAEHLERCEKELEDYRSECFAKAEQKEAELDKELKNDPPERAARIRSQVLERYHNKLMEGEHDIQMRRREVKQKINQGVKEIEREYQKRRRRIEKTFSRSSHGVKQELLEKKRTTQSTCNERREKARLAHSTAIESSRDILRETLSQAKDLLRAFEEAYVDSFPLSGVYLAANVMNQMITTIIKKLHLFCDIRVHEQVKKMEAIKNEIDAFQANCENQLRTQQTQEESIDEGSEIRGDVFLQSSIRMQSALIGKVLLEIDDDSSGFHGKVTTLKEQFAAEVNATTETETEREGHRWKRREKRKGVDEAALKKKYMGLVMTSAQEELELEYKRCVQDIVDFASNSSRLFYREMAFRYWLLLSGFKDHQGEENIYDTLTAVNQEILARFEKRNGGKVEERPIGVPIAQSAEVNSS